MKAIATLTLIFAFSASSHLAANTLTLAADPWCPYNCIETEKQQGFMVEAASTIFEQSSITVKYRNVNWARAKADLNKGVVDAVVGMTKGSNFNQWVFPSEELGVEQMCVYTRDQNWTYTSPEDFYDVRLGVINSYGYGDDADNYLIKNRESNNIITISGSNPLQRLIEMVKRDRIDAFIENRLVMDYFLRQSPSTLKVAGCISEPRKVYIVFSKNNPKAKEYAEKLSSGITELRNNGTLAQILTKYGIEDWKAQPTTSNN